MSDREDEYERDLWRFCAETVARRWCYKQHGLGHSTDDCGRALSILALLLLAREDVPDLGVLIRKAEPDMMAFAESRMTLAEAYRW